MVEDINTVTFYNTGWSLRKIPEYGLPHFKVGKRENEVKNLKRWIKEAAKAPSPNVGVIRAEWGYGKTHLFLEIIKELIEDKKAKILPVYIEYKDLYENGFTHANLNGSLSEIYSKASDILLKACIKSINKYEESYKIPYSTQLHIDMNNLITDIDNKNSTLILSELFKYRKNILIFIDEIEDLLDPNLADESVIRNFFNIFIKEFVERKLPMKNNIFLLLGCTTPAWETYRTHFGEVMGRYIRREDEFELPPLTLKESIEMIDKVIRFGGEDQQFPFHIGSQSTIWRISIGSPFNLLNLYHWVSSFAIDNSPYQDEKKIPLISFDIILDTLTDKEIDLYKGRKSPAINSQILNRFKELIPNTPEILELCIGELGFFTISNIAKRIGLQETEVRAEINATNKECRTAYDRRLFEIYRCINCNEVKLRKILRENGYLTEEGQIFRLSFDEDFLPKLSSYERGRDGLITKFYLPIQPREFQDVFGVVMTKELEESYTNLIQAILPLKQDLYYHLSEFACRRLFPTTESKLLAFIKDPIKRRECERRLEEIFWEKPQESSLIAVKGLKRLLTNELSDEELIVEDVKSNEIPYLKLTFLNRGTDNPDHNFKLLLHSYSLRYNKDLLRKLSEEMENEKSTLSIILYRERDDECETESEKIEVNGYPLSSGIIWYPVERDFLMFLSATGILDDEIDLDDESYIDKELFKESIRLYLKDINISNVLDNWIKEGKSLGYIFSLNWSADYIWQDITPYWKYWLLPHPKPTKISDLDIEYICFGGPRHKVVNHIQNLSMKLEEHGFLKKSRDKYIISQSENEALVTHYLLRNNINRITIEDLSSLIISINDNVPPKRAMSAFLTVFLEEKGIIEKDGYFCNLKLSDDAIIDKVRKRYNNCIQQLIDIQKEWEMKDRRGGSLSSYDEFVRDLYRNKDKWGALGDAVKYTKTWGGEPSALNLFKAVIQEKMKIQPLLDDIGSYCNEFEELLNLSKDACSLGIEKTKKLMEHFSKLSVPTRILTQYIEPRLRSYIDIVDGIRSKGEGYVDMLHESEYIETFDARDQSKELHKLGQFEELEELYNKVNALHQVWKNIKNNMEEEITLLKDSYEEYLSDTQKIKEEIESFRSDFEPKFSVYILDLVENITPNINQIEKSMESERKKSLSGINLKESDLETKLESQLRTVLDKLINENNGMLENLEGLLSNLNEFLDLEKGIRELITKREHIYNINDRLEGAEDYSKKVIDAIDNFEKNIKNYDELHPSDYLQEINIHKLQNTIENLKKIFDDIKNCIDVVEGEHTFAIEKIKEEKKYLRYLAEKISEKSKREKIFSSIVKIDEEEKWTEKRKSLDKIFKKLLKSLDIEGWSENDFEVLRIVYDLIINSQEMADKNFEKIVLKCKDKIGIPIEDVKGSLLKIIEEKFLDVFLELRETGD